MKLSLYIELNAKKLKKVTPSPIFAYAELIEVLREHGFVHRTQMDRGFINDDSTVELVREMIDDAKERLWWLNEKDIVKDCFVEERQEPTDLRPLIEKSYNELLAQGKIKEWKKKK